MTPNQRGRVAVVASMRLLLIAILALTALACGSAVDDAPTAAGGSSGSAPMAEGGTAGAELPAAGAAGELTAEGGAAGAMPMGSAGTPTVLDGAGAGGTGGDSSEAAGAPNAAGSAGAEPAPGSLWAACTEAPPCNAGLVCGEFVRRAGDPAGNRVCTFPCLHGDAPMSELAARCAAAGGVCGPGYYAFCVPHQPIRTDDP